MRVCATLVLSLLVFKTCRYNYNIWEYLIFLKCLIFKDIIYPMTSVVKGKHFRVLHIVDRSGVKITNYFLTSTFKIYRETGVVINLLQGS